MQQEQQEQDLSWYQGLDDELDNHPGFALLINMKASIWSADVSVEQIASLGEQFLDYESNRDEKSPLDEVIARLLYAAKNTLETNLRTVLELKAKLNSTSATELATSPEQKQKKNISRLPMQAKQLLLRWLRKHNDSKRLSPSEKAKLAKKTSLTEKQVANWIINARRRYLEKKCFID